MSRAERRQYERTMGRGRTPGAPGGPRGARPPEDPRRGRGRGPGGGQRPAPEPERRPADLSFGRRFWTWTLIGAVVAGLLMLSVSWDPASRPPAASLAWGAVGLFGWLIGAIGARLLRRRLAQR